MHEACSCSTPGGGAARGGCHARSPLHAARADAPPPLLRLRLTVLLRRGAWQLGQALDEYEIDLDWASYELHPETLPGGISLSDYLPDAYACPATSRRSRRFGLTLAAVLARQHASRPRRGAAGARSRQARRVPAPPPSTRTGARGGLRSDADLAAVGERAGLGNEGRHRGERPWRRWIAWTRRGARPSTRA